MNLKILKSRTAIGFIIWLIVVAISYFYFVRIPKIVQIEKHRPEIEQAIKDKIPARIKIGALDTVMTYDFGINLKAKWVSVKHTDDTDFIKTGPASIKIAIWPLLRNKVIIKEISAENVLALLERQKNGNFNINDLIPRKSEKPSKYKVSLDKSNIILKKYTVNLTDNYRKPPKLFDIKGENISVTDFTPDKFIRVAANGNLITNNKEKTLFDVDFSSKLPVKKYKSKAMELKANVVNLKPGDFLDYINKYGKRNYESLTGSTDFSVNLTSNNPRSIDHSMDLAMTLNNVMAKEKSGKKLINFGGKNIILAKGSIDNKKLHFDGVNFRNSNLNISFSGNILNYRTKKKQLDLKATVPRTKLAYIVDIFPKEINFPYNPFPKLDSYNVQANVAADLAIKGYYRKPGLYGFTEYDNVTIFNPKTSPVGQGRIDFTGKALDINSKVVVNPGQTVIVKGTVAPFLKTINLAIKSNTIDFGKADPFLLALRDLIRFKLGPVTKMKISAVGKVDMLIKGKYGGENYPNIDGEISFKDGYAKYAYLSKPAHGAHGKILFNKNKVIYDNIAGFVEDSKARAKGYSTLQGYSDVIIYLDDINLKAGKELIDNSYLLRKLAKSLKRFETVSGRGRGKVEIYGTEDDTFAKGFFAFNNATAKFTGFSDPYRNAVGKVDFNDKIATFNNIKGNVVNSPVTASGYVTQDNIMKLKLSSPKLDLNAARILVKNSEELSKIEKNIADLTSFKGTADVVIDLYGNVKNEYNILRSAKFTSTTASFIDKKIGIPVESAGGTLIVTQDRLIMNNLKLKFLNEIANLNGQISGFERNVLIPRLNVLVPNFDIIKLRKIVQIKDINKDFKDYLDNLENLRGNVSANIDFLPGTFNANLKFNNASATFEPLNLPVQISNGSISMSPSVIKFNKFNAKLSDSRVYANGSVLNYLTKPYTDLDLAAKVKAEDIDEYINSYLAEPLTVKGIIPVSANVQGDLNNWKLSSQLTLNKGTEFSWQREFKLPINKVRTILLDASGTSTKINLQKAEIALSNTNIVSDYPQLSPEDKEVLLLASGTIDKFNSGNPVLENFSVSTPNPIDIRLINPAFYIISDEPLFMNGTIKADVNLSGKLYSPKITGRVSVNGATIPSKEVNVEKADVIFNDNDVLISNTLVKIADSPLIINAVVSDLFDSPVVVKKLDLTSPSLDMDRISTALRRSSKTNNIDYSALPPFVIADGKAKVNELVIGNLITSNLATDFSFTPDWLLSINNLGFNAAEGVAAAEILYNLKTTEISTSLRIKDMKANAVASTLVGLNNEIYGNLSGESQFTTKGTTSQELISNANGSASFEVRDGRLVRLGSLEYLLRAVNVLQSGVTGLNVNNILDLIIPQKTGYFNVLNGTITVKDGIIRTDNITSEGNNLSLYLSGNIDMTTDNTDITVLGRLSKKVSGLLGPLGSISINTFINFIPGIGFLPSSPEIGLFDVIPGLSKIPGLGLGSKKYRRFVVNIKGNLYDQSSVKTFRWLD